MTAGPLWGAKLVAGTTRFCAPHCFPSFTGFVRQTATGVAVLSNCARLVDAIGLRLLEAINES
jgi:hypothetical protein